MEKTGLRSAARAAGCLAVLLGLAPAAHAVVPRTADPALGLKPFTRKELIITTTSVPLQDVLEQMPNRLAWESYLDGPGRRGGAVQAYIDPRSGAVSNLLTAEPLIPGRGVGNTVTLASLGQRLGRAVAAVDATVVADVTALYVHEHAALLGLAPDEYLVPHAASVNADLWQVSISQGAYPGRIAATISHGNLVVIGVANWISAAALATEPTLTAQDALDAGFASASLRTLSDEVVSAPRLEVILVSAQPAQDQRFTGPIGTGYGHRLVWRYQFRRRPDPGTWEVTVDAHTGEVLALADKNRYLKKRINGGVYPLTNTEVCPDPQHCGAMQSQVPMPFADTGRAAPNDFTNSAGLYDYAGGGTSTTTLFGRYVRILLSSSGRTSASSTSGSILLGGINGEHDFEGATSIPPARTAFYELNKLAEIGRGYLPQAVWPQASVLTFVNDATHFLRCNAYYEDGLNGAPGSLHFAKSGVFDGDDCRNNGEIASVMDHEWGHGLDVLDVSGPSNPSEAFADIAAIYRTQASCLGHGFFVSRVESGCGTAPDGSGPNVNEDQRGIYPNGAYCATNCSGTRDADWGAHNPPTPAGAADFVCRSCEDGDGPCGREVHCAGAPASQAAWDLVTRDLTAAPYNLDSQSAFLLGNRLFYQGSGNIGAWYGCACEGGGLSNGCAAENAYVQWVAADDDNGTLLDGTPHMGALYNAFSRHGIACTTMVHKDSGCPGGPSAAPTLTAAASDFSVALSWTAVAGASRYRVFRTEGHAGCNYGKALIAEVAGLAFTDTEVAPGRAYSYNVVAAGASSSCAGRASTCKTATPAATGFGVSCSPSTLVLPGLQGSATTTCTVSSAGGFDTSVALACTGLQSGATCAFTPATVTPPATSQLRVTRLQNGTPGDDPFLVRATPSDTLFAFKTTPLTLSLGAGSPDRMAAFDGTLLAPSCGRVPTHSCDTGATPVAGRGAASPEPRQPNTIASSCADGAGSETPVSGTIDRVRIDAGEQPLLTSGQAAQVTITLNARAQFAQDAVDVFTAGDAASPAWALAGTLPLTSAGPQTLSKKIALAAGSLQAVRVQYRRGGTAVPCAPGPSDERDDLLFAVVAP